MFYDDIFKNKVPLRDKFPVFGFCLENGVYVYSCGIVENQFTLTVRVMPDGKVESKVTDPDTGDEYVLHLADEAVGSFVGKVRSDCRRVLQAVADSCFAARIFKSEYAARVIEYVREKYQNDFEYLWQKFPNNAVVRRSDNRKWYAALLTARKSKIGLPGDDEIEIIDLRMRPEEIEKRVDGKKYFAGYHMNKRHWITLCLGGSAELSEILGRIDESYVLADK